MRRSIIGRSYAEALFELGETHNAHDDLVAGLNTLANVLQADVTVRTFIATPKLDVRTKQDVLRRALGPHVSPLFLNFLMVVLRKRRHLLLREIAREYGALLDEKLGRLHVQVTLAHESDDATERRIAAELSRILGREVIPHVTIDEHLLGGILVRYGDHILDGSLRRRLLGMRQRLLGAALPAAAQRRAAPGT